MKLKYLFSAILSSLLLIVGCVQEQIGTFEDIKLSSTNVSIPAEGGEVSVTLTTTTEWAFVTTDFSWLTLDGPTSGEAGEYVLTFSAEKVSGGRELSLEIVAGSHSQYLVVRQGTKTVEMATCAEVRSGVDGKVYRVTGVCTSIANDLYGNWYLNDGTGEVYVYGTLDKDGATKNFSSWKMEVGDFVTVEGPRKDYNGTIELVDVTVLSIEKSLLKIEEKPEAIAKEGGEYQLTLLYKGSGVQPSVPAVDADGEPVDYRDWISVVDIETKFAEATKLDPNPADTAVVTIKVLPNGGAARNGIINFTSGTDEASSTVPFEFTQEGSIAEVTVADFLAAAEGTALYELTGVVKNIKNTIYGNFDLVDATGSVYVYGLTNNGAIGANDKKFAELGINEGDVVTIVGTRASYNGTAQVGGTAYLKEHVIAATASTVANFLAQEKSKTSWYKLTGTITNLKTGDYGNFHLVDETGSVYVYGLTKAPVAKNDKSFPSLGLKEGDVVTLVGTRDYYGDAKVENEKDQVGGPAYYISHVTPSTEPEIEKLLTSNVSWSLGDKAYKEKATVNGTANLDVLKLGTSSVVGSATFKLPSGTKRLCFYGVAWNGKSGKVKFTADDEIIFEQEFKSNAGAANNAPYTLTVTDSDFYEVVFNTALDTETTVSVSTESGATRVLLFGMNSYTK